MLNINPKILTEARKTGVAIVGFLATVVATGLVPDPERTWIVAIIGILSALGVNLTSNKPASVSRY